MNFAKNVFGGLWLLCFFRLKMTSGFTQLKIHSLSSALKAKIGNLPETTHPSLKSEASYYTALAEMLKPHAKLKKSASKLQAKIGKIKELEAKIILLERINKDIDTLNQF